MYRQSVYATSSHITYLELCAFIAFVLFLDCAQLPSNFINLGLWKSLIGRWGHGGKGEGVLYLGTDKKTN